MTERKKSRYKEKRDSGKQLYGPGCCGHKITVAQIERCKSEARELRHYSWTLKTDATYEHRRAALEAQKERNKKHAA